MRNTLFTVGGCICVVCAFVGIFVPVLPTTPFLLLAAFLFARGSDRALRWLLNNRWFGSYIRNYREGRGIALRDKVITLTLLWLTIGGSAAALIDQGWVRWLLLAIALGVTIHLLKAKTYQSTKQPEPRENFIEPE